MHLLVQLLASRDWGKKREGSKQSDAATFSWFPFWPRLNRTRQTVLNMYQAFLLGGKTVYLRLEEQ